MSVNTFNKSSLITYPNDDFINQGHRNKSKEERLFAAVSNTDFQTVMDLFDPDNADGVDINSRDAQGNTPLHIAASMGSLNMVSVLISKGAKINIENKLKQTPYFLAIKHGHDDVAEYLSSDFLAGEKVDHANELGNLVGDFAWGGHVFAHSGIMKVPGVTNTKLEYEGLTANMATRNWATVGKEALPKDFPELDEGLANMINLRSEQKKSPTEVAQEIREGKIVTYLVRWPGHFVCLSFRKIGKDYFILKSNAGEGSSSHPGVEIYKINNPKQLESTLQKLYSVDCTLKAGNFSWILHLGRDMRTFFDSVINKELDLKERIYLPLKGQTVGNCGFASPRGIIKGHYYLENLHVKKKPEEVSKLDANFSYKTWKLNVRKNALRNSTDPDAAFRRVAKKKLKITQEKYDALTRVYEKNILKLTDKGTNKKQKVLKSAEKENLKMEENASFFSVGSLPFTSLGY
jgi:hypothetical protein